MTVTYRRAGDETGVPGGGGGGWFIDSWRPARAARHKGPGGTGQTAPLVSEPCQACETKYDVRIEPREAVVIRIRGRSCRECNPHWRPPPEAPGGQRRITIVPTQPSGGMPHIETLNENLVDKSATYLPERLIEAPYREENSDVTQRTNAAWQNAVAPIVSTVLVEAEQRAVEQVWQPEHCEVLEAVAEALDNVWAAAVPLADETTMVLRLASLPAVAAALVVDIVDKSTSTAREPVTLTGELLRFTGITICAATQKAVTCGRLRHELVAVPEVPDEGIVRLLEAGFARALTASTSEITIRDFLAGLDTAPERVKVEFEPAARVPKGPIEHSRVVTIGVVDGPSSTAIFGG